MPVSNLVQNDSPLNKAEISQHFVDVLHELGPFVFSPEFVVDDLQCFEHTRVVLWVNLHRFKFFLVVVTMIIECLAYPDQLSQHVQLLRIL